MSFLDKLRNKVQQSTGRAKEDAGREAGDPELAAEGRRDRMSGDAKQVGERLKDAGREVRRMFRR